MTTSNTKRYVLFGILFSVVAIVFAVLYFLNLISTLDLMLATIYVTYFVGIALMYNGGYTRERNRLGSSMTNFAFAFVLLIASTALLLYGLISGQILLF